MTDYVPIINEIRGKIGNARLMAVSKTRSKDEIMAVYNAGVKLFGENHVQEIVEKFSSDKPSDLELHMIGHLQINKVAKVVPLVDMIESVDSIRLLEKINSISGKTGKKMQVLLEFNTSGEEAKSGFCTEEELLECLERSRELDNISVKGLMTVGPLFSDTSAAFARLASLREECMKKTGLPLPVLSMGMSSDYMTGIRNGSTEVRIGTLIFGKRNYV